MTLLLRNEMEFSKESLLARDKELTAFKLRVLEKDELITTIIDEFDFQLIDAVTLREYLINVGDAIRRHPNRYL
jgi:hypothetical protein